MLHYRATTYSFNLFYSSLVASVKLKYKHIVNILSSFPSGRKWMLVWMVIKFATYTHTYILCLCPVSDHASTTEYQINFWTYPLSSILWHGVSRLSPEISCQGYSNCKMKHEISTPSLFFINITFACEP